MPASPHGECRAARCVLPRWRSARRAISPGICLLILSGGLSLTPAALAAGPPNGSVHPQELLPPLPADPQSPARLRQAAGPDARCFQTEHFLLVHTARTATVRRLGARLEAVYRANVGFMRALDIQPRRPAHKLEVLVFGTYDGYRAYQRKTGRSDRDALGFYEPAANRSVFFDLASYPQLVSLRRELEDLRDADWARRRPVLRKLRDHTAAFNAKVIQHEAAHQIHFNTGVLPATGVPTWLVEGLAQMFELPFHEAGVTLESSFNRYRLRELRTPGTTDQDVLVNLRRLIADDQGWRGGADYCRAWALTSYLYHQHRARFSHYLRELTVATASRQSEPVARARRFAASFGPLDADFAAGLDAYVQRLQSQLPPDPD